MARDELSIEFDDRDGWITLSRSHGVGDHARGTLPARDGFTRDDIVAALLATAWVTRRGSSLLLGSDIGCRYLAGIVDEMLGCFSRDKSPSRRLEQVRLMLAGELPDGLTIDDVSWWHCAWLDVLIREDAADEARVAAGQCEGDRVVVELEPLRRRRIEQLWAGIKRMTEPRPAMSPAASRMAPSGRSRSSRVERGKKRG
jgi:hypothetical protein